MLKFLLVVSGIAMSLFGFGAEQKPINVQDFNRSWLFHRGNIKSAIYTYAVDTAWRVVNLPHDWSIENLPDTDSPFSAEAETGISGGFSAGGEGWYRKHFTVSERFAADRVVVRFDGVYMNADVWVNNRYVGNHYYGYTDFEFDLTDYVHFGGDNLITVRVTNRGLNCRWYTGSGIYRKAEMKILSPIHRVNHGSYVTTPEVGDNKATVRVISTIANTTDRASDVEVRLSFVDDKNNVVATTSERKSINPNRDDNTFSQQVAITAPKLWSLESPYLYKVVTDVLVDGKGIDRSEQSFGIRTISFDSRDGFCLNGKSIALRGGCIHHDNGPLGSKALPRAEERKIELLKHAGFNALRMAHNPPSAEILDVCDRLGMLVIDEAFDSWRYGHYEHSDFSQYFDKNWKNDLDAMLLRDRNHPSIIMWSIGNEIPNKDTPEIVDIARMLAARVRELDPTRAVTAGVNSINDKTDDYMAVLDVAGYNYALDRYDKDHERHPERVIYCSESYPSTAYQYWKAVEQKPWVIGDFVWTAFDYIGEASIGWCGYPLNPKNYPWNHAYCGDIDICGGRRPQSYFRETLWSKTPVAYLFVTPAAPSFPLHAEKEGWSVWDWQDAVKHWNFEGHDGRALEVVSYTNCTSAELFLNGRSLGRKTKTDEDRNILKWNVPYQAGELKLVGFQNNKKVSTDVLRTASRAASISVTADRRVIKADGMDLCYVDVKIVDSKGIVCVSADNLVNFTITGDAVIEAVANANPMSVEAFVAGARKAWRGECMAIVRAKDKKGKAILEVTCEGFDPVAVDIEIE